MPSAHATPPARGGMDPQEFERVYDRNARRAFGLAWRLSGCRHLAEDAVQAAFLDLWRNSARYDPGRGSESTWVLAVVRNRTLDLCRRRSVRNRHMVFGPVEEDTPSDDDTHAELVSRHDVATVRRAVDDLPPNQREVLLLAYAIDLSHSEIAELLQVPLGTVKGRMRLALSRLRVALPKTGPDPRSTVALVE